MTQGGWEEKVLSALRREQKYSDFIHSFANAAKSYAAKRKSNEKSSQITISLYFESLDSS